MREGNSRWPLGYCRMADDTTPKERTRTQREIFKSAFSAYIDKTDAQVEQINLLIAL
jgi:hypothetical protein